MRSSGRHVGPVLAMLAATACRFGGANETALEPVPLAPAVRGEMKVTIEEVGVLRARDAPEVKSPHGGKVAKVVEDGTDVVAGQPILWLDTSDLETNLEQLEAELRAAESEKDKQLERIALQHTSTALDVASSESQLAFEARRLEKARKDDADAERQLGLGLISRTARERMRDALRDAELGEEKSRFAHERKLEEVKGEERKMEVERQQAERTLDQTRQRRDEVARMVDRSIVLAPAAGEAFLPKTRFRGGEERPVRVGDQVGPWTGALVQIPDRTKLEVRSQVDESYLQRVTPGTRAEVHVTAVEGLSLGASVRSVDYLAVPRSRSEGAGFSDLQPGSVEQVVFPLTLDLDTVDTRLQPGMTVGVSFLLETLPDVLTVPEDAVLGTSARPIAYVQGPGGAPEERELELGVTSGGRVVVTSGLAAGESVYRGDPRER